mmetsp:Transcript_6893/g.9547  ORF Transcript_6893/g.9547 Transcript_6893/m.9547 type:complete len:120 (+) Transcript_6893:97-456(+)
MNKVVSSYFDEAHRSLQSNRESPGFSGAQHLQLPPLRTNSPPSDTAETLPEKSSLRPSASLSMLEYSDKATRGIMEEKYQQALSAVVSPLGCAISSCLTSLPPPHGPPWQFARPPDVHR